MRLYDRILEVLERRTVELIAYEDLEHGSISSKATYLRGQFAGQVDAIAAINDIPVKICPIGSVKLLATEKGNASKPEMVHAARCKLGVDVRDHNEADALWVLKFAQAEIFETEKRRKVRSNEPVIEQTRMF